MNAVMVCNGIDKTLFTVCLSQLSNSFQTTQPLSLLVLSRGINISSHILSRTKVYLIIVQEREREGGSREIGGNDCMSKKWLHDLKQQLSQGKKI